jgi:hypothetical protein
MLNTEFLPIAWMIVESEDELPEPELGLVIFDKTHSVDGQSFFWFVENDKWVLRQVCATTLSNLATSEVTCNLRPAYGLDVYGSHTTDYTPYFSGLSDGQILRRAAEALQLNVFDWHENHYAYLSESDTEGWNPLANKGDALSLIPYGVTVSVDKSSSEVTVWLPHLGLGPLKFPARGTSDQTLCRALTYIIALVAIKGLKL